MTSVKQKEMETINTNSKYPENHFLDSIKAFFISLLFFFIWKYGAKLLNSNHMFDRIWIEN